MKEYPYLSRFLLGVLQFVIAVLAFKYYENLTAGAMAFTYPALMLMIQDLKSNIKNQEEQKSNEESI